MIPKLGDPIFLNIQMDTTTKRRLDNLCDETGLMRHELIALAIRWLADYSLISRMAQRTREQNEARENVKKENKNES